MDVRLNPQIQSQDPIDPASPWRVFHPIDTLVRTPEPGPIQTNGMSQLAQTLASVNPKIQQFLGQQQQQYVKDQTQAGKAAAMQSAQSWGDAVKANPDMAAQSPWFQAAYKEIYGENQGMAFADQAKADAITSGVLNNEDPNAVHGWLQQRAQAAMAGMDQDTMKGFLPQVLQAHRAIEGMRAQQAVRNSINSMSDAVGTQFGQILDSAYQAGGGKLDPATVAAQLNNAAATPKFAGLPPAAVDKLMIQAVTNEAVAKRDPSILDVLNQQRQGSLPGDGLVPGPGSTMEGRAAILKATDEIHSRITSDNAQAYIQQERARSEAGIAALQTATKEMLDNGGQVSEDTLKMVNNADPRMVSSVLALSRAFKSGQGEAMGPQQTADFLNSFYGGNYGTGPDGKTPKSATQWFTDAVDNGQFQGTSAQVASLMSKAHQMDDIGLYSDPDFKTDMAKIDAATQDPILAKIMPDPMRQSQVKQAFAMNAMSAVADLKKAGNDNPMTRFQVISKAFDETLRMYGAGKSPEAAAPSTQPAAQPAAQAPKAEDLSPSGAPKLDFVSPRDKASFALKYGLDPVVTRDLQDRYTPEALKRAFNR